MARRTKKSAAKSASGKPAAAGKPASGKFFFDWRTAYFAIVAIVSVLALGFSLVSFLQDIVLLVFPSLLEADTAKDAAYVAQLGAEASKAPMWRYEGPRNRDIVQDALTIIIMGGIFWFHGVRFFREARA